jgi:hypothetical protein
MIVKEIPASFTFRLHCAQLQRDAERKERLAQLKAAQDAIRKGTTDVPR